MSKFTQKHVQISFCSKLKEQNGNKICKKQNCITEICKKQANFNQNKPKTKQPASLQKNPQTHKKASPNSQENRKVGNTGVNETEKG